jgi:hypothetical protein
MTPIVLGQIHGTTKKLSLDLNILLRTRLLIQANSGGGKSWVIRLLAEKLFGRIPVIILDPEGEFPTLREKYGYVLVGKGGETPADTRSAGLVAHKLLELRASAVCDLYEMKPGDRHRWVRLFLESVIDAPKSLWRPTVFIVDEAHVFCPEKGFGESEASEAMVGLPTRGRKRRFCTIFATQRLGKLRKDASAELLNRLVGPTFEDVDLKRAAELLSIRSEDRRDFDKQMRVLEPGYFFALGRAITKERLLVRIGAVETSHEIEEAKYGGEPPPPPEKVRALLPKLADLPKQAEEKARTEAELSGVIRSLRAQLAARPKETIEKAIEKRVEVPVLKDAQVKRMETLFAKIQTEAERHGKAMTLFWKNQDEVATALLGAMKAVAGYEQAPAKVIHLPVRASITARLKERTPAKLAAPPLSGEDGDLKGPEQRILDAIGWLESLGIEAPEQTAVAFLARYKYGGGAYNNPRGKLRTMGLVEYIGGNQIRLTETGKSLTRIPEAALTTQELHARVMARLKGPEQRILQPLLDAYPNGYTNEELSKLADYSDGGGAYNNPRGRLRSMGLIEYRAGGKVFARDILFLERSL